MNIFLRSFSCLKQNFITISRKRYLSSTTSSLLSAGAIRQRPRLKRNPSLLSEDGNHTTCSAYCNGESYNLNEVKKYFVRDTAKYSLGYLPSDAVDVLHVVHSKEDVVGDIFLFRGLGAFVCWNIPQEEISILNQVLPEFSAVKYPLDDVQNECEQLNYFKTDENSTLLNGDIYFNCKNSEEKEILEKLSLSNAMALSCKLAMWEISLEKFSATVKHFPMLFKTGRTQIVSTEELLKKIGELLTIRHDINLYSDLLMTPDFYWDRKDLELLYTKTCTYLEISKRTVVMNEKLNHCSEVIEMLQSHLSNQYSHRLEWIIIILISVEIFFEVVHLIERYH